VRQVVLYIGRAKMRMAAGVDLGETNIAYRLLDIRTLEAEALIASGRPGDLALVPKWVDKRLSDARQSAVERWSKKLLTASTLEGVLGKK
jgi:hypothetical protein